LVNPGRGFATTHNVYNEDIGDRRYQLSGAIQKRRYWDYLEPLEGRPRFMMIDSVLAKAARNRQHVNFRVICQNIEMRIPQWAKEEGIKQIYQRYPLVFRFQSVKNAAQTKIVATDEDITEWLPGVSTIASQLKNTARYSSGQI
jgi:hypothetical protein